MRTSHLRPRRCSPQSCATSASGKCCRTLIAAVQVPYESLKRTTRDRKAAVEEYTRIMDMLQMPGMVRAAPSDSRCKCLHRSARGLAEAADRPGHEGLSLQDSPEVRDSVFDTVNTQLAGLKRKV